MNYKPTTPKTLKALLFFTSILLSLNFIFYILYEISDHFTGFGFNESVIYHVFYGIQGFNISLYAEHIILTSLLITCVIFLSFYLPKKFITNSFISSFTIILLALLLWFQPFTNNLFTHFGYNYFNNSFANSLHPTINKNVPLSNKKNIVYIYAESLEGTYLNEKIFPNLTPNLNRLAANGLYFTNLHQTYGANNTIAGMVASQCGTPFDINGAPENTTKNFLPSLYCLGDILSENQYNLSYIGGASLDFAGKGNFYRSHHFQTVKGKEELSHLLKDKTYINRWGLYDDFIFQIAKKEFSLLESLGNSFALFTLTLDTHHPDYFLSKLCSEHLYGDKTNKQLNAVHCSDYQISEFVNFIQQSEGGKNTMIVIASDHLSPGSDLFETKIPSEKRTNLLIILNSGLKSTKVNKVGSTLDISPSIVNLLGNPLEQHNLGSSLLSKKATLQQSTPLLSQKLKGWSYQLKKFND